MIKTTHLVIAAAFLIPSGCVNKTIQADLSQALTERDSCHVSLQDAQEQLEACAKAERKAKQQLDAYRELAAAFREVLGADVDFDILIRQGRLVVQLPNAVLYETGKAELSASGKAVLDKVARVLEEVPDRRFMIAGHTDNVPVNKKSTRFRSNWELSTLRATTAVEYLVELGVNPAQLAAVGYGEFLPDATNDVEEGRAENRRLEVIVMPRIDELPVLPGKL